jgi:hypothetical protein
MSLKNKQHRDEYGRYTPKDPPSMEEETKNTDNKDNNMKFLTKLKTIIFFSVILILSLPWTVIFFEPAKTYGTYMMGAVGNMTSNIRNNVCSCGMYSTPKTSL